MAKYVEIGIGNTWLIRTEFETADGSEYEVPGVSWPIKAISRYIRIWFRRKVVIIDTRQGLKTQVKKRHAFKVILGLKSEG